MGQSPTCWGSIATEPGSGTLVAHEILALAAVSGRFGGKQHFGSLTLVFDDLAAAACSTVVHDRNIDTRSKGQIMIMALIDFEVAPESRHGLLEALQPLLAEARNVAGNLSYRTVTDSENRAHVGMIHEWETLDHFRAYASSDLFARIGLILRPATTTPPVSRRLNTTSIEEVRG